MERNELLLGICGTGSQTQKTELSGTNEACIQERNPDERMETIPYSFTLNTTTAHARGKAEAAMGAGQKAQEECRLARITAKEFSPSFQHRGNGQCAAAAAVP
ncbi:hypothetical protein Z043_107251 [Scleropages formosus]|uniref:Uncharacterized protein n=1 Tax=Scleropages formosus TaxID=113540 RepID=A0A0P7UY44_SCLFO|nr:hypothetical protein Z043_107251 [Scleropages formosus]